MELQLQAKGARQWDKNSQGSTSNQARQVRHPATEVIQVIQPAIETRQVTQPATQDRQVIKPAIEARQVIQPATEVSQVTEPATEVSGQSAGSGRLGFQEPLHEAEGKQQLSGRLFSRLLSLFLIIHFCCLNAKMLIPPSCCQI